MEKRTAGPVTQAATGGATLAGAITVVLVWIVGLNGVEIPEVVAGAITVIIAALGALVGGWLVKPGTGRRRG